MKTILFISMLALLIPLAGWSQWSDDYLANTPIATGNGEQTLPKIAVDTQGNLFITFFNTASGNYDVSAAYLDKNGFPLWPGNLTVSHNPQDTWISDYDTKIDQDGNCLTVFSDIRNGNDDPFIYKISPSGAFLWGNNGINVSDDPRYEYSPVLCVTSENNAVVAFIRTNDAGQNPMVLVTFDEDGNRLIPGGELVLTPEEAYSYANPYLVPSTDGDFIVVFSRNYGSGLYPNRYLYAQRYHIDGTPAWGNDAVLSNLGGVSSWAIMRVIPDGYGGVIAGWYDDRDNNMVYSSFVQYIGHDGVAVYEPNGVELSLKAGDQKFCPAVAGMDATGHLYAVWEETDYNQNYAGLYAQKLDGAGERLWTDNGKMILSIGTTFADLIGADLANDTVVVVYDNYGLNAVDDRILATGIDKNGDFTWTPAQVMMSDVPKQVIHPVMSSFYDHQWVVAWADTRNDNGDIYAQNLNNDGTIGISTIGIPETQAVGFSIYPNPATNVVTIDQNGGDRITVLDYVGHKVLEQPCTGEHFMLDISSLKPGFYMVRVTGQGRNEARVMVVR